MLQVSHSRIPSGLQTAFELSHGRLGGQTESRVHRYPYHRSRRCHNNCAVRRRSHTLLAPGGMEGLVRALRGKLLLDF